jgi:hypothetical protein
MIKKGFRLYSAVHKYKKLLYFRYFPKIREEMYTNIMAYSDHALRVLYFVSRRSYFVINTTYRNVTCNIKQKHE